MDLVGLDLAQIRVEFINTSHHQAFIIEGNQVASKVIHIFSEMSDDVSSQVKVRWQRSVGCPAKGRLILIVARELNMHDL
jgi:hypothetical protein